MLLRSHAVDEDAHELGFRLADRVYPVDEFQYSKAEALSRAWRSFDTHPIIPAAALELGVVLISLTAVNLFGGSSLSHMASQIARDEYRHVAANTAIMRSLKLRFTKEMLDLIDATIDWVFQDLNIPESEVGIAVDRDLFRRLSTGSIATAGLRSTQ
jgi:hypothetical protein